MDKKLRSRVSRRKRYKPLPSPCPSKGAYQDRVLWLCIPVEGPYYLGSASLGGKYESDLIVGKGTLSAWYRAVWVLVPAVTEFSGNASCSAPAGLGLLEVAAPLQRRMCREGKKPSGQSGCCPLPWENWEPLPCWPSALEAQREVLGSLSDNPGSCITFCDCEGCAPSWASIFFSFRVKKLVFGISQALHSK